MRTTGSRRHADHVTNAPQFTRATLIKLRNSSCSSLTINLFTWLAPDTAALVLGDFIAQLNFEQTQDAARGVFRPTMAAVAAWDEDRQMRSRPTDDDEPHAVSNTQPAAADPNTAAP